MPGWKPLVAVCGYHPDGQTLTQEYLDILAAMGEFLAEADFFVVAADWNLPKEVIEGTGLVRRLGAILAFPPQATCVMTAAASVIDGFMCSSVIAPLVERPEADMSWPPRPHRPVTLRCRAGAAHIQQLVFSTPQRLPTEVPFGPLTPPQDWAVARDIAEHTARLAKTAPLGAMKPLLQKAWTYFINTMEKEIEHRTGVTLKKHGERARHIAASWRPVMRGKPSLADQAAVAAGWKWLSASLAEILRLSSVACPAQRAARLA